jgi:hypothetical protein
MNIDDLTMVRVQIADHVQAGETSDRQTNAARRRFFRQIAARRTIPAASTNVAIGQ